MIAWVPVEGRKLHLTPSPGIESSEQRIPGKVLCNMACFQEFSRALVALSEPILWEIKEASNRRQAYVINSGQSPVF